MDFWISRANLVTVAGTGVRKTNFSQLRRWAAPPRFMGFTANWDNIAFACALPYICLTNKKVSCCGLNRRWKHWNVIFCWILDRLLFLAGDWLVWHLSGKRILFQFRIGMCLNETLVNTKLPKGRLCYISLIFKVNYNVHNRTMSVLKLIYICTDGCTFLYS